MAHVLKMISSAFAIFCGHVKSGIATGATLSELVRPSIWLVDELIVISLWSDRRPGNTLLAFLALQPKHLKKQDLWYLNW